MVNKILKWFYNPAIGVLPLILFLILQHYISHFNALLAGILTCAVITIGCLLGLKARPPYMMITTVSVFLLYLILTYFYPFNAIESRYVPIVLEVLFLCCISLMLLFSPFFKMKLAQIDRRNDNEVQQTVFNEYLYVVKCYQFLLFSHLLIVVAYQVLPASIHSAKADWYIYTVVSVAIAVIVIVFEYIRLFTFRRKISTEDWLPVVNEGGSVIGKVAFSISRNSKRIFLHPVVRIAVIYKGMFYLAERPSYYILDPGKIDYPFEKYLRYDHSLDEAVFNLLYKQSKKADIEAKFIFRYMYKGETTHRLIYLYAVRIQDEEEMRMFHFEGGKLWTEKQIQENLGKSIFSECFEKEYEVLENTVLMAERFVSGSSEG